jgi:hypothetical protein
MMDGDEIIFHQVVEDPVAHPLLYLVLQYLVAVDAEKGVEFNLVEYQKTADADRHTHQEGRNTLSLP